MKDYAADREFVARFREGALEIARRKIREVEEGRKSTKTVVPLGPRLATGGKFGGLFLWDSVFGVLWARHAAPEFPIHSTLDNFYKLQLADGFIGREYSPAGEAYWSPKHPIAFNPPILSWAEIQLFRDGLSDVARLETVYPHLVRCHAAANRYFRRPDGLYFGDALGCGMDELPRWPHGMSLEERMKGGILLTRDCVLVGTLSVAGEPAPGVNNPAEACPLWDGWLKNIWQDYSWNRQAGWIDISSQMAFDALNLASIAEAIGRADEAASYRKEHAAIAALINEKCWDEERGFYFDCTDEGIIPRYHCGAFWTLLARVAPPERARRFVDVLLDEKHFNRPVPLGSLSASDPDYNPESGYWRGSVWPPIAYMAIRGLRDCGFEAEAESFARRWYNACANLFVETGTVWENISPEQCDHPKNWAMNDFCGWGALAPIAIPAEFGWL